MCLPVSHRALKAGRCHPRGPAYTWVLHTPTRDPKAAPPGLQHSGEPWCCWCLLRSRQGHPRSEGLLVSPSSPDTRPIFITAVACPKVKVAGGKGAWGRGPGRGLFHCCSLGALLTSTVQPSESVPHPVGILAPESCLPPPGSLLTSGPPGSWQSPLPVTCCRGGGAGGHMRGLTALSSWRGARASLRSGETGQRHHEPGVAAPSPGGPWNASRGPGGLRGSGSQAQGLSF